MAKINLQEVIDIYADFHERTSGRYDYSTIECVVKHVLSVVAEAEAESTCVKVDNFLANYEVI